ncbi:MAG: DUF4293 domain-containing protein [Flavobacteriales bacterium]|nr:MAG: DUF4293 domain-containing protein [Flavobacteriales bacterium]
MLQRIQSVFLFIAALLSGLTWLFPVRRWALGEAAVVYRPSGVFMADGTPMADAALPIPYSILHTVVAAVLLVAVFLYGNRPRQARVVRGGWLVALLAGVLQFISSNSLDAYLGEGAKATGTYGASFFLPIGVVVFAVLAERAIRKDEHLVRSADRLR